MPQFEIQLIGRKRVGCCRYCYFVSVKFILDLKKLSRQSINKNIKASSLNLSQDKAITANLYYQHKIRSKVNTISD